MRIALITGASSGMGVIFAKDIDKEEKNIDEIWLLARRKDRLEEVAGELNHTTRVIPMDLTAEGAIDELEEMLDESVQVGIFVNAAGYGKIGSYDKVSRYDSEHMVDLNCKVAVTSTLAILPRMQAGDRIVQLCSTSSFIPVTHLNIYAASKTFLYSYTRSLRMELLPRGIIVTAICPWWVDDTSFLRIARDNEANPDAVASIKGFIFPSKKEHVVRRALRASRHGRAVSTPGIMCTLVRIFAKLIPNGVMLYVWELLRRISWNNEKSFESK